VPSSSSLAMHRRQLQDAINGHVSETTGVLAMGPPQRPLPTPGAQ
jgi:hypothetical protein